MAPLGYGPYSGLLGQLQAQQDRDAARQNAYQQFRITGANTNTGYVTTGGSLASSGSDLWVGYDYAADSIQVKAKSDHLAPAKPIGPLCGENVRWLEGRVTEMRHPLS